MVDRRDDRHGSHAHECVIIDEHWNKHSYGRGGPRYQFGVMHDQIVLACQEVDISQAGYEHG